MRDPSPIPGTSKAKTRPDKAAEVPGPKSEVCAPWVPESTFPAPRHPFISFVRNILLTSPDFPRFYADVVLDSAPNSHEAKILRANYQKIIDQVNSLMANPRSCTHIKASGVRCGSPALSGEQFCY